MILRRYRRALKATRVDETHRFHDLRHTFGTQMAAAGVPMRTLQEFMGHRDVETTQRYADYAPSAHEAEWVGAPSRPSVRRPIGSRCHDDRELLPGMVGVGAALQARRLRLPAPAGRPFEVKPKPARVGLRMGRQKSCFSNALCAAMDSDRFSTTRAWRATRSSTLSANTRGCWIRMTVAPLI